ncbi:MAG: hypothetical protein V9E94_17335 [Microthrixaceae bacterium]
MLDLRPEGLDEWQFPTRCPSCGHPLVRAEGEAQHLCLNAALPAEALGDRVALRVARAPWTSTDSASSRSRASSSSG